MRFATILVFIIICSSCFKGKAPLSEHTNDIFYVESGQSTLPVYVSGNTKSKVIVIYVHGGPGDPGIFKYSTYEPTSNLRREAPTSEKYATALFHQPNAGFTQGNSTRKPKVPDFVKALDDVCSTLLYRYGSDQRIFILSHSWGGFISCAYLTKDNYQKGIKGWINMSGSHNYNMNDSAVGKKIKEVGARQIAQGRHVDEWKGIIQWIEEHPPNGKSKRSNNINACGVDARALMSDSINGQTKIPIGRVLLGRYQPGAISSWAANLLSSFLIDLNQMALDNEMSSSLQNITIPVLNIYGQYDFIVPSIMGEDIMNNISSQEKELVIMKRSYHNPHLSEPNKTEALIDQFIEKYK